MRSGLVRLAALIAVNVAYAGWSWLPARSEAPVRAPQLSSIGPSLRLLAEIPFQQVKPITEPRLTPPADADPAKHAARQSGTEADPASTQLVCRVWGPFDSRAALETVEAEITSVGGEPQVTESAVPGPPEYLVYVGILGEARNAGRVLKELKSQAVDSALIYQGRFSNTLSVGVFSRSERARRQLRKVTKLGHDAGIEEIDRSHNVFHLQAHVRADFQHTASPSGPCREIAQAY